MIELGLPKDRQEIGAKADEVNDQRAVSLKQDNADWLEPIRDEFIPNLDKAEAAVMRKYIRMVERRGGTLLIRDNGSGSTVSVTWRNKKFEVE